MTKDLDPRTAEDFDDFFDSLLADSLEGGAQDTRFVSGAVDAGSGSATEQFPEATLMVDQRSPLNVPVPVGPDEDHPNNVPKTSDVEHSSSGLAEETPGNEKTVLREAWLSGDMDTVRKLVFSGCPDATLRPQLWLALLGVSCPSASSDETLRPLRAAYFELGDKLEGEGTSLDPSDSILKLRAEVESDTRISFQEDPFLKKPEAAAAIVNVVSRFCASRKVGYAQGSNEIAALLLWVMASGGADLGDAEADTYWCFTQVMADADSWVGRDDGLLDQVQRTSNLLALYDPPLAELLALHGLEAFASLRLGRALCTRAGFSLVDTVRIWDSLLADHFELCDHIVVAILLLSRGELMQLGSRDLAETLLAAPAKMDVDTLLRNALSVCAFERRARGGSSESGNPHPIAHGPRRGPGERIAPAWERLSHASAATRAQISEASLAASTMWAKAPTSAKLWGRVKRSAASAVETAKSGGSAALDAVKQRQAMREPWNNTSTSGAEVDVPRIQGQAENSHGHKRHE